jgi:hypothetical protein
MIPWLEIGIGGGAVLIVLVGWMSYLLGKRRGQEIARLMGGYCEVCQRISDKFYVFRGAITCERCMHSILSNRDMKCKFCDKPVDKCVCI